MGEQLIETLILNAPAVGVLVWVVYYQSDLIRYLVKNCDCDSKKTERKKSPDDNGT